MCAQTPFARPRGVHSQLNCNLRMHASSGGYLRHKCSMSIVFMHRRRQHCGFGRYAAYADASGRYNLTRLQPPTC